jgi:glycosyltransferase involved in cell wall biosynthesis
MISKALTIIVPAYNEEELIGKTLADISNYFRGRGTCYEVLVVNDGSTDATRDIIKRAADADENIRIVDHVKNSGKGMAVKTGIEQARSEWCLFMDADGATSIREWPAFEAALGSGARAVHASRHLPDSKIEHPQPLPRRVLGAGYRALCRLVFGLPSSDFNCGFKAYETELARKIYHDVQMTDWSFDVEVISRLKAVGVVPFELPVRWSHFDKKASLAPFQTAIKTIRSILSLRQILKKDRIGS